MADVIDRISPLEALAFPGIYGVETSNPGVEISERLPTSLVQVMAWPDTLSAVRTILEKSFNGKLASGLTALPVKDGVVMPTGPGRWLIEGEDEVHESRLRKLIPANKGAVTGLTHGRVIVSVSGEKASWVLATGFALDFHRDGFPVGDVRMTSHHEIGVIVHRADEDAYDLYVATSYVRSFWQWLTTAAGEVGYRIN